MCMHPSKLLINAKRQLFYKRVKICGCNSSYPTICSPIFDAHNWKFGRWTNACASSASLLTPKRKLLKHALGPEIIHGWATTPWRARTTANAVFEGTPVVEDYNQEQLGFRRARVVAVCSHPAAKAWILRGYQHRAAVRRLIDNRDYVLLDPQ